MQRQRRGYELILVRAGVFGATDTIRSNDRFHEKRNGPGEMTFQQVSSLFALPGAVGLGPTGGCGHCHMGRGQGRIGAGD